MNSDRTFTPKSKGEWNGYVVSGKTREQRRERLAEVPEEWRDSVKRHVETYFAIINHHKRMQHGKYRPARRR